MRKIPLAAMLAGFLLLATHAHAVEYIIAERPNDPRGGPGSFQQLWAFRILKDPASGLASFFNDAKYADGSRRDDFDPEHIICAHPNSSELGQIYRVTRLGKSIVCTVRDTGPAKRLGRALDITPKGAEYLGITKEMGLAPVWIERLSISAKPK